MTEQEKKEFEQHKDASIEALQEYFNKQDQEHSDRIKQWNQDFKESLGGPYQLSHK